MRRLFLAMLSPYLITRHLCTEELACQATSDAERVAARKTLCTSPAASAEAIVSHVGICTPSQPSMPTKLGVTVCNVPDRLDLSDSFRQIVMLNFAGRADIVTLAV